jgi:hypothetical protein
MAVAFAVAGCTPGMRSTAPSPTEPVTAFDVLQHPDEWLGRDLVVDIYDPLLDEMHSSAAPVGGYEVEVASVGTHILNLVADGSALPALPPDLAAPLRVHATLERHEAREASSHRVWRVLVVHEIEPLSFPEPEHVAEPRTILRHRRAWDRHYVQIEGVWRTGFEISMLDEIWIDVAPGVEVHCEPPPSGDRSYFPQSEARVRLTGFVHTRSRYGHMGIARAELVANEVAFLDTPGCTPPP